MTDNEKSSATAMSDNEIVQVAECCIQSQSKADCFRLGCPAATAGGDNCRIWELTNDDSDNAVLNQIIKELVTVIKRQKAEIERLTTLNQDKLKVIHDLRSHLNDAHSAAIKKFAERVKSKKTTAISCDLFEEVIRKSDIDNFVKEKVGDANIATTTETEGDS